MEDRNPIEGISKKGRDTSGKRWHRVICQKEARDPAEIAVSLQSYLERGYVVEKELGWGMVLVKKPMEDYLAEERKRIESELDIVGLKEMTMEQAMPGYRGDVHPLRIKEEGKIPIKEEDYVSLEAFSQDKE